MTNRRARALLMVILPMALTLLPGCHDVVDIERRMIVSTVGLDAAGDGRFKVTIRMPLVKTAQAEQSSGAGQSSVLRTVTARGLVEAAALAQEQEEHALFFGQCRAIVLGEGLVRRGVLPILDPIYRHTMVPPNAYVIVARPTAEHVLRIRWPEVELHGQNIRIFLDDRRLPCVPLKLWCFIRSVLDVKEDPVLPLVEPSAGGTAMRMVGAIVFRGARAVAEIDCRQAILYQILRNTPKRVELTMETGGKVPSSFSEVHGRTRIEAGWREGRPLFTVRIRLSGNLSEYAIQGALNPESIRRLEEEVASQLRGGCQSLLRRLQSLGSDPLELGNRLRIQQPTHFSVKEWPAIYRRAGFRVSVSFRIDDLGKLR